MQCPKDSTEMASLNRSYFTSICPDRTYECPVCGKIYMLFRLPTKGGVKDFLLCRDDKPEGVRFNDFIEDSVSEWRKNNPD